MVFPRNYTAISSQTNHSSHVPGKNGSTPLSANSRNGSISKRFLEQTPEGGNPRRNPTHDHPIGAPIKTSGVKVLPKTTMPWILPLDVPVPGVPSQTMNGPN